MSGVRRTCLPPLIGLRLNLSPCTSFELVRSSLDRKQVAEFFDEKDSGVQIREIAQECFSLLGVWPISFSYPSSCKENPGTPRRTMVSEIVLGVPYSYSSQTDFHEAYRSSYYGITHKKGRWDCFRHFEILSAGATPLMLHADLIPRYPMVHYPKGTFRRVASQSSCQLQVPGSHSRGQLKRHFSEHLTYRRMIDFVLASS